MTAVTIAVVAIAAKLAYDTNRIVASLDVVVEQGAMEEQTYTAKWKDASGIEHEVRTPKKDEWSDDEWAAAHASAVNALKALFPPVTPP